MFFKLRKIYFKIYHLFKFLGVFILALIILTPSVKADECSNLITPGNFVSVAGSSSDTYFRLSPNGIDVYSYSQTCTEETDICMDRTKQYTLFALDSEDNLVNLTSNNVNRISLLNNTFYKSSYPELFSITFTPPTSSYANFFSIRFLNSKLTPEIPDYLNSLRFYLVEGESTCIPTPPAPIEYPITDFYSIFLDKLGMLADYSLENKYLLSFIGVILVFILLELFLLLLRGGRRR